MIANHHSTATGPETKVNMEIANVEQFSHVWRKHNPNRKKIAAGRAFRSARQVRSFETAQLSATLAAPPEPFDFLLCFELDPE